MDLISLDRALLQVPSVGEPDYPTVAAMISAASDVIETYCNRVFARRTWDELHSVVGPTCSVWVNNPPILLADEPTGALDSSSAADVRRLLLDLNSEGQTILLVTHDVQLAASTARRTIELVDGAVERDVVNSGRGAGLAAYSSLTRPAGAAE